MSRTTQEVFDSHLLLTLDWDLQTDIETNYSPGCILLSSYGAFYGRKGIQNAFRILESQIPDADFLYKTKSVFGEIAFLEWQAESDDVYIDDGADTYLIREGKIIGQTIHYTLQKRQK
ncbi:MAG: nuclear transport factor 2 family protein [Fibrobacter sp.]|nr:nuclear transport factor 2 family protein [Fibrobacter sp.]